MATMTFDYDNPLVGLIGNITLGSDHTGPNFTLSGGQSVVVTGSKIEVLYVHAFTGQTCSAFWIDGVQQTVSVPDGTNSYYQQDYITIFNGSDGVHTVESSFGIQLGQTGTLRVTGATPTITAPFQPYGIDGYTNLDFTVSGAPSYITFPQGTYKTQGNVTGHNLGSGQSIRLRSKGGKVVFYGAYSPSLYHIYRDGTKISTNAVTAYGTDTNAPYRIGSFDLGTPDSNYHDFEIVLTVNGFLIQDLAVETGTIDTTASYSPRPVAIIAGDSIRAGNAAGQTPAGDVTQYFPWLACRQLGWDIFLYAAGGSTIDDAYSQGVGTPNLAATIAPFVTNSTTPVMGEEAWGVNDTRYPSIDTNGLYTTTDGTVAGRTQGAQYPGSGDQAFISTYSTSLQSYISIWFTHFPTTPLLISELFRGGANDWLRAYWQANAQQPAITAYLASNPGKPVSMENTDSWYNGSDGLHPQVASGEVAAIVPVAEAVWAAATGTSILSVTPTSTPTSTGGTFVSGASGGTSPYTYSWSGTGISFSSTTIANPVATVSSSGTYSAFVTVTDVNNNTATGGTTFSITSTATSVAIVPPTVSLETGATQLFTAMVYDQFGIPMNGAMVTWGMQSGVGSVNSTGLYSAGHTGGAAVVRATSGSATGTASISVISPVPAPTSIQAYTLPSSAEIVWLAPSEQITGYRLFRNGVQIYDGIVTNFTDTGLTVGTTYVYSVLAYDTQGNLSSEISTIAYTLGIQMMANQESNEPPMVTISGVDLGDVVKTDQLVYRYNKIPNIADPVTVNIEAGFSNCELRYTLNGKNPTPSSHLYTKPLVFAQNGSGSEHTAIKVCAYDLTNGGRKSKIMRAEFRVI